MLRYFTSGTPPECSMHNAGVELMLHIRGKPRPQGLSFWPPGLPRIQLGYPGRYRSFQLIDNKRHGGEGGIRTPGTLSGTPVFKTGAINHSATSPHFINNNLPTLPR